ncbi:MAG: hypothetical protein HC802_17435, partial [Caldilineaceae bacterium]|nr:hypothetical protein [Caldilineaceae bacterium]
IIPSRRAAHITPAVSNASAGAVEHLLVAQVTNINREIDELKSDNVWIAGLDGAPETPPIQQADLSGALALVVGSEGSGLSRLTREKCDFLIRLPMVGQIESLNAATAGSIALFAIRQTTQPTIELDRCRQRSIHEGARRNTKGHQVRAVFSYSLAFLRGSSSLWIRRCAILRIWSELSVQTNADGRGIHFTILDASAPTWNAEIDRFGVDFDASNNPAVFPYHFLQAVLPRIGGRIVLFGRGAERIGVGFLFPCGLTHASQSTATATERIFTLRYHILDPAIPHLSDRFLDDIGQALGGAQVVGYDPNAPQEYAATHQWFDGVDVGCPDRAEAEAIRHLHQQIWASPPEFLYPTDMHSVGFGSGTSLVARVDGNVAGFLMGFAKFDGPSLPGDWSQRFGANLRLESQIMGVLPEYRGKRIAHLLKRVQGAAARTHGIGVVHWTADPLQFPNAALNFGLLGAIAFDFYPDLYPFRNDLNRVHASRFGLTWLVETRRTQHTHARAEILALGEHPEIVQVNRGWSHVNYSANAPMIAIETPANWTQLQREDAPEAIAWRETTDAIFGHYIGRNAGQYAITGVGAEGNQRFLIGERAGEDLWTTLGAKPEE